MRRRNDVPALSRYVTWHTARYVRHKNGYDTRRLDRYARYLESNFSSSVLMVDSIPLIIYDISWLSLFRMCILARSTNAGLIWQPSVKCHFSELLMVRWRERYGLKEDKAFLTAVPLNEIFVLTCFQFRRRCPHDVYNLYNLLHAFLANRACILKMSRLGLSRQRFSFTF